MPNRFVVVSLHPAIDRTIEVPTLHGAEMIRGRLIMAEPSGKAVNVIHTLSNFGHRVLGAGFLARYDLELYFSSFRRGFVTRRFITVDGATRQNITLLARDQKRNLHITAGSLSVTPAQVERLRAILERDVRANDCVIISGSLPAGLRLSDYAALLAAVKRKKARLCVDASGGMQRTALKYRPWLLKPNQRELAELIGGPVEGISGTLCAARELLDHCENLIVTLGAEGALLVTSQAAWHARDPQRLKTAYSVGCGDALLAGFLDAWSRDETPPESLRFAVACGSACVRSPYAAVASPRDAQRLLRGIKVKELK